MAQATNIVIADGAATPVSHAYVPSKVSDNVATYFGPGNTLATREQIVVTRREATSTAAGKVTIKLVLPVEQTVDGQVVMGYQDLAVLDLVLAPKSTTQNRKDARVLMSNLLKDAAIIDVVDNGNGIF